MNENLCDFFGCSNLAVAEYDDYDQENDEVYSNWFCRKHHPNGKYLKSTPVEGLLQFDPTNFEHLKSFVMQHEALNKALQNLRDHQGL